MPYFEGAKYNTINNPNLTDVAGDATFNVTNDGLLFIQHMTGSPLPPGFRKKLENHVLSQIITSLPRASAAYNDYTTQDKRRVACFEGTRKALLGEIAKWIVSLTGPRLYLLWGIAGVGKSTVAQTVAERADHLCFLGASFFFSRDEIDRKNARMFFTTIAFHLCVYNRDFACAIGEVLLTERGCAATSKEPLEQLNTLILAPLRNLTHQFVLPVVIVVDALDECDDQDGPTIFIGLARLARELPFFKVILTCRPRPHLQPLIDNPNTQTEFHLQNIEDKIVDNDIRHYLEHSLSPEQVRKRLPGLRGQWSASHQEIAFLVLVVGQLFIIASTAVLFILDTAARNPASRMKTLQDQFAHNRAPLSALNEFYSVILRNAVPEGSERDIVEQYQLVVGTIILLEDSLPVEALSVLIGLSEESVYAVLDNLQSVISTSGKNIPRVYHKSFPDYLTDDTRCKDDNLCIVTCIHHTRIAVRCLRLLNGHLKKNILDIGTHQGYMHNNVTLRKENISSEQVMEKIPGDLRYACVYWANHVEGADTENLNLSKEVETFVMEHLLHWLEALSWIDKIDVAYPALRALSKYMKPTSSDMRGAISDALRFIARSNYEISQSALYPYHCALAFTPTNCPLYKIYSKEMLWRLECMPTQWDPLITTLSASRIMLDPVFSHDSSRLSLVDDCDRMTMLDAESGVDLQTYEGDKMAVAHDFSVVAVSKGCSVTLWNTKNRPPVATVTSSLDVHRLALSFDGVRLAVGSVDGTVGLWDARNITLIASLGGNMPSEPNSLSAHRLLKFSPNGNGLASVSKDGTICLWNGDDGRLVGRLDYKSKKHSKFVFSRDGRRLASLTEGCSLTLWDGEKGIFIDAVSNVGDELAISEDGSFIATGGNQHPIQLWSGNPLFVVNTLDGSCALDLAISCDILAVASENNVTLYDINDHAVIATLELDDIPWHLALSPDCTRLVVKYEDEMKLFDVPRLKASIPALKRQVKSSVSALTFSPDSSRLASGLYNGTVELWDPNCAERPIATHELHSKSIATLAFSSGGQRLASVSWDEAIRFWDGKNGMPMGQFQHPFTRALAFSPDLLAAATYSTVTLFSHNSLLRVGTLGGGGYSLSFSGDGTLLASASRNGVTVWNVAERAIIATFTAKFRINRLTFSPDGSQLAAKVNKDEGYQLFDVANKHSIEPMGLKRPSWISGVMNGLLISLADRYPQSLIGRCSGNRDWIEVLWIPKTFHILEIEFGSSIVAMGSSDGRILFVRFPTAIIH